MKEIDTYQNKNVLVLGLGKSGFAVSELLLKLGAHVTLNDKANLDENKKAQELNSHYGKNYKAIIQGKHGYVDAEYLNASFLVSIQNNCMKLKEELHNSNFNIE